MYVELICNLVYYACISNRKKRILCDILEGYLQSTIVKCYYYSTNSVF